MRLVLFLGFITIFISSVFIFFTLDVLVLHTMSCVQSSCNINSMNMGVAFGFGIITVFVLIDLVVLYIIFKTWTPDLYMRYSKYEK